MVLATLKSELARFGARLVILVLAALERVVVHVVFERVLGHFILQALADGTLELLPDFHARLLVVGRLGPYRHPVTCLTQTDDGAAQLVAGLEVLANHGQDGVEPHVVYHFLAIFFRHAVTPCTHKNI